MISTKTHATLDYLVGILLILAPWLLGFADDEAAMLVPTLAGSITILYSLLTNYELSMVSLIPYPMHLGMDVVAALLLIASPWIFGFNERIIWPHVAVGIVELLVVLLSQKNRKTTNHA